MTSPDQATDPVTDPVAGTEALPPLPPVVYVPVGSVPEGDSVDIVFRRTLHGRLALVLYTALDRLVDGCGPHQPWILLPTERLVEVHEHNPFDVVYFDLEMPEEERERPPGEMG